MNQDQYRALSKEERSEIAKRDADKTKIAFYDEHVQPMVSAIHALCFAQGISFAAAFDLTPNDENVETASETIVTSTLNGQDNSRFSFGIGAVIDLTQGDGSDVIRNLLMVQEYRALVGMCCKAAGIDGDGVAISDLRKMLVAKLEGKEAEASQAAAAAITKAAQPFSNPSQS